MENLSLFISFFILYHGLFHYPIFSHHTPGGGDAFGVNNTRFIDPFTGKRERPNNYMILSYDYQKGAKDNKNIHTGTAFAEFILGQGAFAVNFSIPYIYYEQKNRSDATRIGKVQAGFKYMPFFNINNNYIFILDGRLGFPSGADTDKFTGGDYYSGTLTGTVGYVYQKISLVGKVSGIFPLSRIHNQNQSNNDGIPYYARSQIVLNSPEPIELKKVTVWSAYITYMAHRYISVFSGFLYRTPYEGIEKTTATGDRVPLIFREASLGASWNFSEKYILTFSYRYPLNRGREFRIYESAYQMSFLMEF